MAVLALVTANKINVGTASPTVQHTLPAAVAITAGQGVFVNSAGKFALASGATVGARGFFGVATRTCAAGEACTALRRGIMDGWDLSALAHDAPVFVSNTDGALDSAAGTLSIQIGRVLPVWGEALGSVSRVLWVEPPQGLLTT
jgi:hypothetical protein